MYRILIADDSSFMRDNLKEILLSAGHEVVGMAVNGLEAVELYKKTSPDIITMDITMPQLNGIEALQKIIEYNKDANVLMLTSLGKPEKVLEALNNGARNYITKPFEKGMVLKAINAIMSPGTDE
jgi:two-component system chemotaxis response regulator CheY